MTAPGDPVRGGQPDRPRPPATRWFSRGVAGVGAASFFSDTSHEMATSVLPTLVTSIGGGPATLGVIEGVSDALTGLAKLAGGSLAADPNRRGRVASGGYVATAVATSMIGLAVTLWQVAVLRAFAWISRGLRSPARDALLVSLVPREAVGRAAAVERAGDNLGAVAGPLLAAALAATIGIRHAIVLGIVPGLLAAVAVTIAAREARGLAAPESRARVSLALGELRTRGLVRLLVPIACFELGNVATTLLILRAEQGLHAHGLTVAAAAGAAAAVYAAHNIAAAGGAAFGGRSVDRSGPWRPFLVAAGVAGVGYATFAVDDAWPVTVIAFLLVGCGVGIAETTQTAVVALHLPDELRAQGFGLLGLVQAGGDLGSSIVAGLVWAAAGPAAAFGYAAAWMGAAALLVTRVGGPLRSKRQAE